MGNGDYNGKNGYHFKIVVLVLLVLSVIALFYIGNELSSLNGYLDDIDTGVRNLVNK